MTALIAAACTAWFASPPALARRGVPAPPKQGLPFALDLTKLGGTLSPPGVTKGERYKQTIDREIKTKVAVSTPVGEQAQDQTVTEKFAHTDVAEASEPEPGKGPPATVVRTFEAAEVTANGETSDYELTGRAVRLACKPGETGVAAADKGALSEKADVGVKRSLYSPLYNHLFGLLPPPDRFVKPGDDWALDPAHFADRASPNHEVDLKGSSARGKLVKAYLKGGRWHAMVEVTAELALTGQKGENVVPFTPGSKVAVEVTVDGALFNGWQSQALTVTEVVKTEVIADIPAGMSIKITGEATLKVVTTPLDPVK